MTIDATDDLDLDPGWRVAEASRTGPFVTRALLERPDGVLFEWTSRRHRKRLGLRLAASERPRGRWGHPRRSSWLIGGLFMVGSTCFALGVVPAYADRVSATTDAWTFFVGSIFFTSAAYLQFREAITAPGGPARDAFVPRGVGRFIAWKPHRIDWWACSIQFIGTLFFNVTTFAATRDALSVTQARRWVWAPDVFGSVCFLVASWFAYVEADAEGSGTRHRSVGWWIALINLAGSVAFGASAVAARYLHSTGQIANLAVANLGTFVGAVCFFVGAALLPVESAHDATQADESHSTG